MIEAARKDVFRKNYPFNQSHRTLLVSVFKDFLVAKQKCFCHNLRELCFYFQGWSTALFSALPPNQARWWSTVMKHKTPKKRHQKEREISWKGNCKACQNTLWLDLYSHWIAVFSIIFTGTVFLHLSPIEYHNGNNFVSSMYCLRQWSNSVKNQHYATFMLQHERTTTHFS